jgi:hypothetical protein
MAKMKPSLFSSTIVDAKSDDVEEIYSSVRSQGPTGGGYGLPQVGKVNKLNCYMWRGVVMVERTSLSSSESSHLTLYHRCYWMAL